MEKLFEILREDLLEQKQEIKDLTAKVDQLLLRDAKRLGISIASSFVFSVLFALAIAFIEKN